MKKKKGIGVATEAVKGALAYLYKRTHSKKQKPASNRHRTNIFSKAKPPRNPDE
jgi:hypothetical protein